LFLNHLKIYKAKINEKPYSSITFPNSLSSNFIKLQYPSLLAIASILSSSQLISFRIWKCKLPTTQNGTKLSVLYIKTESWVAIANTILYGKSKNPSFFFLNNFGQKRTQIATEFFVYIAKLGFDGDIRKNK